MPIFAVQGFYIKNLQKIDAFSSYFKVDGAGETDEQRKHFKYVLVYLQIKMHIFGKHIHFYATSAERTNTSFVLLLGNS